MTRVADGNVNAPRRYVALTAALLAIAAGTGARAESLDAWLGAGARIMTVMAHPDDETLVGPILAKACIERSLPCHFAVLTAGEGGDCSLDDGCPDGLGATRMREMIAVADAYGATISWGGFRNFPNTGTQSEDWIDTIRSDWTAMTDPVSWIQDDIEAFKPDLIFTVDPEHGFYGHAEHILVGRLMLEATGIVRQDDGYVFQAGAAAAHRPGAVYIVLNRYWAFRPFVGRDPLAPTETWSARQECAGESCIRRSMHIAALHASQEDSGIGFFQFAGRFIKQLYLYRIPLR